MTSIRHRGTPGSGSRLQFWGFFDMYKQTQPPLSYSPSARRFSPFPVLLLLRQSNSPTLRSLVEEQIPRTLFFSRAKEPFSALDPPNNLSVRCHQTAPGVAQRRAGLVANTTAGSWRVPGGILAGAPGCVSLRDARG